MYFYIQALCTEDLKAMNSKIPLLSPWTTSTPLCPSCGCPFLVPSCLFFSVSFWLFNCWRENFAPPYFYSWLDDCYTKCFSFPYFLVWDPLFVPLSWTCVGRSTPVFWCVSVLSLPNNCSCWHTVCVSACISVFVGGSRLDEK